AAIAPLRAQAPQPPVEETDALVARLVEESQKHKVSRKADPKDPVWQAERYASGLADDISLFNQWMIEIVRAYAVRGDAAEAAYVADQLPGAGSPLAHAELALVHARRRENAAAEQHLTVAQAGLSSASRSQADLVRSRCAHALHLMNRGHEAAALEARLEELELLHLETHLQKEGLRPALTLKQAQERLALVKAKGVDATRCRYLLACARRHFEFGEKEKGLPFLPEVGNLASANGLPPAQHVLLDLARVAWAAGQKEDARKSMNLFLKCCGAYADHAEWKALYIADAAALLVDWQEQDEARAWLKQAESGLPKVFVLDAPTPILAVGRQWERLDGAAAGDRFATMAAQAGMAHPHPRAQAGAAVQVCLFYADAGRPLPEAIARILSQESQEGSR
ncbi:MAG TPA: hypothetical protein VD994_04990, partial [Prosthecobacter sp.]|nr:hypothetical protein [Prosthecobacter sp.]